MKLFLSPHFDDAAYSCGGTIYTLNKGDQSVRVVTVMAGELPDPLPHTPIVEDLHQRWQAGYDPIVTRKREDEAAMRALGGVSFRYLPIGDCVYRTDNGVALYPTEESLWDNVHPHDPAVARLAETPLYALTQTTDLLGMEIYAPMGVGAHVDHLIVRQWAYRLADANPQAKLYFYADYPYIRDSAAIDKALVHHRQLVPELFSFSESAMNAKIAAMRCYRSQVSTFWPDEEAIDADARSTFTYEGQFAERYWHYIPV
ncbi:PIG-L family deacetylase [Phototrophicus methaneseepsis]|uniref:PIG-L family deacetylase n=1 Tax=Phototrophicus methaneseepsis TaxID=2710758 RepID=A0A7S8IH24_9CHLR|nr:PIG-L family deacetylase [Phototrophicus methaneseepsis]QPC84853.1 PIG-L family deacetylase [Phototrophicus methaneseepsis]